MTQLLTRASTGLELTSNPLVDNGLAVIAALSDCERIEDLTLRKAKRMHGTGEELARANIRMRANHMVFINSISMQPSYTQEERLDKYARMTTAVLNNIGHETKKKYCDFCSNPTSVDLDRLFIETFDKDSKEAKIRHYIGRDLFPMVGSIGSDAQGLPAASRGFNCCAKCLFAVQYLPQASILVNGLLCLFQSTSVEFWYQWVKDLVAAVRGRLAIKSGDKVETLGKAEGSGEVVNRLLEVMRNSREYDPAASMIMYQYSNGKSPDLKKQFLPSFTLNFLHEAVINGLREEIRNLMHLELRRKTSYRYSFLNRIAQQEDYYLLYPSRKDTYAGSSPELFLLYQTYIRGYPVQLLNTAYNIALYLKTKAGIDTDKLAANILTDGKNHSRIKKWIVNMADDQQITFDEYFHLFVDSSRNPWPLLRYYLLAEVSESGFKALGEQPQQAITSEYKARVINVGTMIYNRYLSTYGPARLDKLLTRLAAGSIGRDWLRRQFEHLADDSPSFDYVDNWNALKAEENLYEVLYLFRLLFTQL
jgi:hypothetical protein